MVLGYSVIVVATTLLEINPVHKTEMAFVTKMLKNLKKAITSFVMLVYDNVNRGIKIRKQGLLESCKIQKLYQNTRIKWNIPNEFYGFCYCVSFVYYIMERSLDIHR